VPLASIASQDLREASGAAFAGVFFWSLLAAGVAIFPGLEMGGSLLEVMSGAVFLVCFVLGALCFRRVARAFRVRHAVIGADGICFAGALDHMFVPFAEVKGVFLDPNGVTLTTRDGTAVKLPVAKASYRSERAASDDPILARRNELHDLIRLARRRHDEAPRRPVDGRGDGSAARSVDEGLDRGARSLAAWKADLARAAAGGAPYRAAPGSTDALRTIIEDAYAPAERRVAAAFVLAVQSSAPAEQAVHAAIERSADPYLRVALDRAARREIDEASLARIAARNER
jgi:hypothetical protein